MIDNFQTVYQHQIQAITAENIKILVILKDKNSDYCNFG